MTNFSNLKFDTKDVIKLVGFCIIILGMWYDLKTDLKVFKATTELRLNSLERESQSPPRFAYKRDAILPNEIKIEHEY